MRIFNKLWAIFAITSLLVAQTGGAFASVELLPDSPSQLTPPVLQAPADGTHTKDPTPDFSWLADPDPTAIKYQFQLDNDIDFSSTVLDFEQAGTSFTLGTPLADGTYFWRVQSGDSLGGWSGWSLIRSVVIDTALPAAPSLTSPPNGIITNDNAVGFDWGVVSDAVTYHLQVATDSGFTLFVIDQDVVDTHYFPGGPLADNTYYWRVNATDLAGNTSDWSAAWSFTIDTTPPAVPNLLGPANVSFTNDNTPTFSWSTSTGTSLYTLQVSTLSDFSNTVINQSLAGTSFTSGVLGDGLYYWRVNAADALGNASAWSAAWTFTIDTVLPGVPSLLSPANGASINDNTPTFTWIAVPGASQYQIQVDNNGNFNSPLIDQLVGDATFTSLSNIADGPYFWRVKAIDAAGNQSAFSAGRSITIDTIAPAAPNLNAPADGALTNNNTPAFSWSAGAGASQYQIQVDDNIDFSSTVIDQLTNNMTFTPSSPFADGTYYWHVRSLDAAGNPSGYTTTRSFTIDTTPPAAPILTSPTDGALTNDNTPAFSWNTVTGGNQYTLQVSVSSTFSPLAVNQTQPGTTFSPGAPLADGLYYWRVSATDLAGNISAWSTPIRSLSIDTTPPPAPVLAAPANGTLTNDNTPDFTWNTSLGASQYRLQVSAVLDFTSTAIDQTQTATSFTPGNPLADGLYYWRVSASDLAGNTSAWSAPVWSLTIDSAPPGVPGLLSPADASFTSDNTPAFSWSSVAGASQYQLQVSNVSNFASTVIDQTQPGTSFAPGTPLADGLYYWRVRAIDLAGNPSTWSLVRSLNVDTLLPAAPALLSPANASFTTDNTPSFTWGSVTGASQYTLQISTVDTFVSTVINQTQAGTSFTSGALADGIYYWRVNASDLAGNTSPWSAVWSLTIDTLLPAVPLPLAPSDTAALSDTTPDFSWSAVTDAVSYRLQIDNDVNFTPPILENQPVNGTSFTLATPLAEGVYYWHVRSSDAAGNTSAYSATRSFTIDTTPPAAPVPTAPSNGSITNDNTPAFTWNSSSGASQYQVQVDDSNDLLSPIISELVGGLNFTPQSSLADGTYYWHVRALDAAGNQSSWSATWSIVIDASAPAAPSLVAPLDGSFTSNNFPTFSWNSIADAVQYQLQVSTLANFSSLAIDRTQAGLSFTPLSNLADSLYYWRVRAIDLAGNPSNWSAVRSFTIDTQPPAAPTLSAPTDGSISADNTPAFTWNASTGASQYRLQVDNNNNFLTPEIDQWVGAATFTPTSGLLDGTYFWHVQARDAADNLSGWSVVWSVVVDATAPAAPGLLAPADTSLTNDNTPAFSWSPVSGASQYTLQASISNTFVPLAVNQTQVGTSFSPASPLADGIYYWRVNAIDSIGNASIWSVVWSLTIDTTPPSAPTLIAPSDGAFIADNTPSFSWNTSTGASQYTLQVSTVNTFATTVISQAQPGTSFTPVNILADGLYYWRVNASDQAGNIGAWSAIRSFTVDTLVPGVPGLVAPLDAAAISDTTPDFTWSTVADAVSYRIQIDADVNFTAPLLLNLVVNGTSHTLGTPLTEGVYYWHVRSIDAAGNNSAYSATRSFTIDTTPPAAPALSAPANGSTTNDNTPEFAWGTPSGASQYQVQVDDSNDLLSPIISELLSSPSFTPLSSLADGTYYWHVRALDAAGNPSPWSTTWSVVIDATAPGVPVLTAPLDGAFTNDNTPTFSWNAVAAAVQYQVQADDNSGFTTPNYDQLTASTSSTPASSLSDAVLYWRVRARDSIGNWGEWSIVRSFTIDTVAPAAPALVAPLNGTLTADNKPVFSWSSVTGAVSYRLVVDTSDGFTSPYIIDQTLGGLSYAAPSAIADGNYIWRVRANDAAGNPSSYSATRSFTIDTTASSIPTLIEPANGGIIADSTPTFTWGASTGAVLYIIQVDNNSNFSSPLIATNTASTNFTPSGALADGTYFWHIQAKDAADNLSSWSATWSLVVDSTPPNAPSLVSPADGEVTSDNTPTFSWSTPQDAVEFELQVDNNSDFSSLLGQEILGASSFHWNATITDGSYFWRVQALDAAGNQSGWSSVRSFLVDTSTPLVPTLINPPTSANTIDNTPTFVWSTPPGATQYHIQAYTGENFATLAIDQVVNQATFTPPPLAQGLYRWRVEAGDAAGNWSLPSDPRELMIYSYVIPIFSEGFESGSLGTGWSWSTRGTGRIRVANNTTIPGGVNSGAYSLFLDNAVAGGVLSEAEAVLTANLSRASVATLSFNWRVFGGTEFGTDGIYFSDDYGASWIRIKRFNIVQSTYQAENLNLIALATANGLELNDHFQIKFQFWGENPIEAATNKEGYGIDNIYLFALKPVAYLPLVGK